MTKCDGSSGQNVVALIWASCGPYHVARSRALAVRFRLVVIELCSKQLLYGWTGRNVDGYEYRTLWEGAWEDAGVLSLALRLWRAMQGSGASVVLVPGYRWFSPLVAAVWGRLRRRTVVLMTESTADDHPRSWWRERLKSLLVRALFDRAIVGGRRAERYLISLGFPARHIAIGYDVVDNDFYARGTVALRSCSASKAEGLPERYFLYVGRLAPEKNLHALVREFRAYRERGGDWDLVLVGQGPLEASLRDEAQRAGCAGHIHFAGFKQDDELLPPYAFASCFILPSTREPWGLVVNEAMASGLPVLVSDRCGCADDLVEHGGNGFVFDPGQENELADCMLRMNAMSRDEHSRMGERSRQIISNYSLERWASAVARLVESAQTGKVVS